jgi:putative PIN family toxin of toxin-antitoxin system
VKFRIVFDTNIYVSPFAIPGGRAEEAYLLAIKKKFILCSSLAILAETAQKLKEKFGWSEGKIIDLLKAISKTATIVKTKPHISPGCFCLSKRLSQTPSGHLSFGPNPFPRFRTSQSLSHALGHRDFLSRF